MKLNFNGTLFNDLLKGASIVAHDFNGTDWYVLARSLDKDIDEPFTEYKTDEWGEFETVGRYKGSQPTVIKDFRNRIKGVPPLPLVPRKRGRPADPSKIKLADLPAGRKSVTLGEWRRLNKMDE